MQGWLLGAVRSCDVRVLQQTGHLIRRVARGAAWSLERLVHTSRASWTSTPTSRSSPPSSIPYLSTDRFGRPNVIHPASAPERAVRQEGHATGDGALSGSTSLRRGRRAPAPRQQTPNQASAHDAAQNPVDVASLQRSSSLPSSNPPPDRTHRHEGSTPHARPDSSTRPTRKGTAWRERTEPPRSPQERQDRTLTYQLTKAASLREIDDLLKQYRGAPNMIHLAAAARQAVLLGSLPRPHEVRGLLDRHMERLAAVQKATDGPRVLAADSSGGGGGGSGGGSGGGTGSGTPAEGPQAPAEAPKRGAPAHGAAAVADAPTATGPAAGLEAGKAPGAPAADEAAGPPSHGLREVGDVLWAYGKLRAKPPATAWDGVLRPLLLAPGMLTPSPHPSPSDAATFPSGSSPSRGRYRPRDEPDDPQPTEQPPMGQDLAKVAVALARMRELDAQVWRAVARAAAAAAPELPPRALSSILWAFGSARMTHAHLLASSVRAVRSHVHQYNCQDLACTMWAVARLAPPLLEQGTAGTAEPTAAAAAGESAMQLLRVELSDAVRRRLQQQSFKPAELTTLVGALYELSCMYGEAPGGSDEMEAGARTPSTSASRGGSGGGGGAAAVLGARLLRAVSQGVRKSMASLPVGALAEAAEAFQRLGVQDTALYRALAAGLLPRLQHLDGRGLVRAAQALRAAGHDDRGFYDKVLLAARPKLPGLSRHELVALVQLCGEVAGGKAGASGSGRQRGSPSASLPPVATGTGLIPSDTTSSGGPGAGTGSEAVLGFLHAAILHAVSLRLGPGGSGGETAMQLARTGAAGAAEVERGGVVARMEPLRLRQWHVLLRTAVACGWRDEQLANRALDAMLLELHELRAAWLDRVSERAVGQQHKQQQGQQQDSTGGAVAVGQGREALQEEEDSAGVGGNMGSADGIAGLVGTAKAMGRRERVDVVVAAAGVLMEGFRLAGGQAGGGGAPAGGQATAVLLSHAVARELVDGLGYFEPALESSASRTARAAVHLLKKRLAGDVPP